MKNYGRSLDGTDRHADKRDRKRAKAQESRLMRGNRSVFTIEQAIGKRARKAREGK